MIRWKKPDFKSEVQEFERTASEKDMSLDNLIEWYKRGRLAPLTDQILKNMDNTDAFPGITLPQAYKQAKKYQKDAERIVSQIMKGQGTLPAPIVLKLKKGNKYYLIGGNTRLMIATAMDVKVQVYMIFQK